MSDDEYLVAATQECEATQDMAPAALFKFSPNRPEVFYNEVLEDILLTPGQVCIKGYW